LIDNLTLGRYLPRHSIFHGLDPRLKLLGVPVLIVAVFSGQSAARLAALAGFAIFLPLLTRIEWRIWWRGIVLFRWFFIFTLLLHLFFSPGRTLFGVVWLSHDGLLRGMHVCVQLSLATLFASLLTLTTSPRDLAGAIASLAEPLRRLGLPVRKVLLFLLLVLQFIPILREEAAFLLKKQREEEKSSHKWTARLHAAAGFCATLLLSMAERADHLAREIAAGEGGIDETEGFTSLRPMERTDIIAALSWVAALVFVFGWLP
jgi:energy-coupling factor transport system permease protein